MGSGPRLSGANHGQTIMRSKDQPASAGADDTYHAYQIENLLSELSYTQRLADSLAGKVCNRPDVQFLGRHIQQFYWTVTRLVGLGRLHDGSASKPPKRPLLKPPVRPVLERTDIVPASGPRILIDVTLTYRNDNGTGIQRVAREIAQASIAHPGVFPVIIENGQLVSYFRHSTLPDVIQIEPGDRLLLLDAGWFLLDEYLPVVQDVARRGGANVCCVHDLIPLLYPGTVSGSSTRIFRSWLDAILPHCEAVVAISRSVAEDFINYASEHALPRNPALRVGWFHLGADFKTEASGPVSSQVRAICTGTPFFLTVGTLEPRKNHAIALKAFDLLWAAGIDVRYVIVGKMGWIVQALRHRIIQHPEFGRRLFWLQSAGDDDLSFLYRHAAALIQPSIAEGFGLPIVEAAHAGTRVIASNIRVFCEIGGDAVSYFDPMDAGALAALVKEALTNPRPASPVPALSWKDATERLLRLIKDGSYPLAV
ncbi:MAG: glycosyltransferase family 1 protein [Beijerinckiaceae bacterium]|nr:MAG: glycosyltransferase family 1 protein [Beijerinckiaceae bacterium]